ncbi:MAG: flagellar filament capping protein FliD [Deltaproteobacteria bacterium]
MSAVSFSGLSSGLDTASLIAKLVAAEKSSETQYTRQQTTISSQKSVVDALTSAVASLGSMADDLALPSTLQMRTASSSDTHVSVAASGTASSTVHDVRVNQIAAAQVASSNTYTADTAGIAGSGTLGITSGATSAMVTYDATDTLSSIATKINNANAGVSASVLFDGTNYRLMVASKTTGTANAATFVETGTGLGVSNAANIKVPAKDAKLTIDGVDIVRSKNLIDDAVPGLTITANSIQAATDPDSSVTVSNDSSSLTAKLNSFVSAFNSVAGAVTSQLTYNASATSQSALFGDSTLRSLQGALGTFASQTFGTMHLDDLGMSLDKDGLMTLDATKLSTALQSNPDAITGLFVTGGFAKVISGMSKMYSEAGDGILVTKSAGLTVRSKLLQDSIDQIEQNATALQTRLQAQFTQMEAALSTMQSQSSYITQMLSSSSSG